jgi:catechol 2,3-dioxygenase-like lactoylglutathione lyase family enzyme
VHLIRGATLSVADIERSVSLYRDWLDYDLIEDGTVSPSLAASWDAPACTGAKMAVMRPASGADCFLRFVEQAPHPEYKPLRTYGWAAVELCVTDTDAVAARLADSPFEIIGPPKPLDGMNTIYPMQVQGPDGEIVYLTQIKQQPDGYRLKAATSLVDQIFILVLACNDLEVTGAWLEATLGLIKGATMEINYTMINKAFGLPDGTQHALATLRHGDDVFFEIDTYPIDATARPQKDGYLPPGVAMASFIHPDFDQLKGWSVAPAQQDSAFYKGAKSALLRGPDGARIEILECLP